MTAAEGESLSAPVIRQAVRDAGFTATDMKLTAVGSVMRDGEALVLEPEGGAEAVILAGGGCYGELAAAGESLGKIRLIGALHPHDGQSQTGITVESWSQIGDTSPEGGCGARDG